MTIHVVRGGETLESIALQYGLDAAWIAAANGVPDSGALAEGQTLVLRFPRRTHVVTAGDTLSSIAAAYGVTVRDLWRRNWPLGGTRQIRPGQTLVLSYREESPPGSAVFNSYAYPFIDPALLDSQLPYLTCMAPFTYGISAAGNLLPLPAESMLDAARSHGTQPLLHLSTLTEDGGFDTGRGVLVLTDPAVQDRLTDEVLQMADSLDFAGVDVDFEYLPGNLAGEYAAFLGRLRGLLRARRKFLWAALAPKTSASQPGLLYEGHDYAAVAANADAVLLMTYEWGYTYGPPMAVSPMPAVRAVLDYAVTEIPPGQIFLGLSNYGYDWPLPFQSGMTRARSISGLEAFRLAVEYQAAIQYDESAQAPFFFYTDRNGTEHEVWFEDARSMDAKLRLIAEYGFQGGGFWNLMRPFPQTWQVTDALYEIA